MAKICNDIMSKTASIIFAEQQQQELNLVYYNCNCKIVNLSSYIPWPGWDQ